MFNKRLESETQRMTLIGSEASNQSHIQDRAFHPALLDLDKMRVANADCYCRKDSCGNVVGW